MLFYLPVPTSFFHNANAEFAAKIHYPKDAIVVVICPLNALIDSHILELKENPKTMNTRNIVFRVRN